MYTNEQYAEKAIEANKLGKLLIVNDNNELELVDIVRTQEDIEAENQATRDSLLTEANYEIEILNDKVELDIATDEDKALLKKWKLYRIDLKALDVSRVDVVWPEKP